MYVLDLPLCVIWFRGRRVQLKRTKTQLELA
jgi:hypothetical protein